MNIICSQCLAKNRLANERWADKPICGKCRTALLPTKPVSLNDWNFERFVSGNDLPVLVDFWAQWCGPCRQMAPHFEAAAIGLVGATLLAKVNTEESPTTSNRLGITSIPTLILFRNGRDVARIAGALSESQITQWVNTH